MERSLRLKKAVQDFNCLFNKNISYLKQKQIDALYELEHENDLVITLPTGYGKSLIYELLPFFVFKSIVFCICPLNSIITQGLTKLKKLSIGIDHNISDSDIILKNVKYVFGHPEDILENTKKLEVLSDGRDNIFLVIDEAHCIINWGEDFRPALTSISNLLATLQSVTVVAMTATATSSMQTDIVKLLAMKKPKFIKCTPVLNDNIFLQLCKRPPSTGTGHSVDSSYEYIFKKYIYEMLRDITNFPLTIVYTKLKWCGFGVELAKRILQDQIYNGDHTAQNYRVVQFHSPQPNQVNDYILENLRNGNSGIKLIFATIALGMGADLRHVRRVIHVGAPSSIEDYIQEIGRAGRDGDKAEATMYVNNTDLGSRIVENSVKKYAKVEKCRRQFINNHFGSDL